ncbi:calcium-binding EF-hand family protein [Tanacetum coccineum]
MTVMRSYNKQGTFLKGGRHDGHRVEGRVENGGVVEYLVKMATSDYNLKILYSFYGISTMRYEVVMRATPFSHYDVKSSGTIPAKDLVLYIVASGDIRHLNKLLDRVDELDNEPHLKDIKITFDEFKNFMDICDTNK